jgi:hypothetical protein
MQSGLALKPSLTRRSYVVSLLLRCVQRPLLRVIRCRAKKRDRERVLTATPCTWRVSHNSRRRICGRAS